MGERMEPLFENRYTQDESFFKEFYRYIFFCRPIDVVLYVFLGIDLIACVIGCILFGAPVLREVWELFLFVPLFFGVMIFVYFMQVKAVLKQRKELQPEPAEVCLTVTQDTVELSSPEEPTRSIPLTKIKRVFQTKNYLFLRSESKLCYGFRKDAFTKGSTVEMMLFLKEKGIKGAK